MSPVRTLRAPPPVRAPRMPRSATQWSARRAARTPSASSPLLDWGASAKLTSRSCPSRLLAPVRATSDPTAPTWRCVRRSASSKIKLEPTGATSSSHRRSGGPLAYGSASTVRDKTQTAAVRLAAGTQAAETGGPAPVERGASDAQRRRLEAGWPGTRGSDASGSGW